MTETVVPLNDADFDLQLPKPVGYRLLIALPKPEEKGVKLEQATRAERNKVSLETARMMQSAQMPRGRNKN